MMNKLEVEVEFKRYSAVYYTYIKNTYKLHSIDDQPAIVYDAGWLAGYKAWYQNGELHRENDLPAEITENGTKKWYQNGELHRENDLPAVITENGTKKWYRDGRLCRGGGLPTVIDNNGVQIWHVVPDEYDCEDKTDRDFRHRENGPAVVFPNGDNMWFCHGKIHKDDGPAIVYMNGYRAWYEHDKKIKEEWVEVEKQ